jgi:hypothetical protein
MSPLSVIVLHALLDDVLQVTLTKDQHSIQGFALRASDESLICLVIYYFSSCTRPAFFLPALLALPIASAANMASSTVTGVIAPAS